MGIFDYGVAEGLIGRALDALAALGEHLVKPAEAWHSYRGRVAMARYERVLRDQAEARKLVVARMQAEREYLARCFPDALKPPDVKAIRERLKTNPVGRGVSIPIATFNLQQHSRRQWGEN